MNAVTAAEVRTFLLSRFEESLAASGLGPETVPDAFDLLTEGIVDSFGILEMIMGIEEHFGIVIDYENIDPQDLTVVGPLSRFVAQQAASMNSDGG
jgi:acyl carrier protein